MRRRGAVALATLGLGLATAPAAAQTTTVPLPRAGTALAVAPSGDGVIVAYRAGKRVIVERRGPGAQRRTLLREASSDTTPEVGLVASAQAVAVSIAAEGEPDDFDASRVLIGPAVGPLREVAACRAAFFSAPVAVDGPRVGWGEGGCGDPVQSPRRSTPASLAVGGADPAAPVRRYPLGEERVGFGLALRGDAGYLGVLRPSLFGFVATEIRPFGPDGLRERVADGPARFEAPVGLLAGGDAVLSVSNESEDEEFEDEAAEDCDAGVTTLAADGRRRPLDLGGCLAESESELLGTPAVAGDRVAAIVERPPPRGRRNEFEDRRSVVTALAGGEGRRVLSTSRYRPATALGAEGDRVAWMQNRCSGGSEVLVRPAAPRGGSSRFVGSCPVDLVSRRARLRGTSITLRLRCPRGCSGRAVDDSTCRRRWTKGFRFGPGTHSLRFPVPRSTRRRGNLLLRLEVRSGPAKVARVRLRR